MSALARNFWESKALDELTQGQWESLCDGCGKCCLHKLIDDETDELFYTEVACQLLDVTTARCSDYGNRLKRVPGCLNLKPEDVENFDWLPVSCSYRLVAAGLPLPEWHPLITGDIDSANNAGESVANRCVSETQVEGDFEEHIIKWIE